MGCGDWLAVEVLIDDGEVSQVGFQRHVEQVAEDGNTAADDLDTGIGEHSGKFGFWQTQP